MNPCKPGFKVWLLTVPLGSALGFLLGCGEPASRITTTLTPPLPSAAVPTFSPGAGTYVGAQSIRLSSATSGASVYYTSDGSAPTAQSALYTGPIAIQSNVTLQAIAVASGSKTSSAASAQYLIQSPLSVVATSRLYPQDAVGNVLVQNVGTVTNTGSVAVSLALSVTGDSSFSLTNTAATACGAQLAAGASCSLNAQYLPTIPGVQSANVNVAYSGNGSGSGSITVSGSSIAAPEGTVSATTNPLVARYTVTPQYAATVSIRFGPDTTYGRTTSTITTSANSPASLLVAGMRAGTTYHMQASITYAGGQTVTNADQTFTTGALPANLAALNLTITTNAAMTPQPGIELMDPVNTGPYQPYAIDLQGNVIWYYPWTDYQSPYQVDPVKLMPNGDLIAVIGVLSNQPLISYTDPATIMIREFDLEGITVKQLTVADLNTRLAAAGYSLVLADFHHDITVLPNGHWLILANTLQSVNGTNVLGDVVVDVDTDLNPQFVWNEFNYFDTGRQPMGYPDWTHSNAVVYSPTDGNFLVSIRHQNWVVKVNYQNGAGDGSVLWRLGYQGSFTLQDGTDPVDWQYAQHAPFFVGTTTAGIFNLILMDNGNDRIVSPPNGLCGVNGNAPCYSTVPTFQVNEGAMTATIQARDTFPASLYSSFAGNAEVLANGNWEYDLCGVTGGSVITEVFPNPTYTPVWSLVANGNALYRASRQPSLYPNVQW